MKYVIEVNDDDVDDRADELVKRMIDEGGIHLASLTLDLDVRIAGKATKVDVPHMPVELCVVEPLGA